MVLSDFIRVFEMSNEIDMGPLKHSRKIVLKSFTKLSRKYRRSNLF